MIITNIKETNVNSYEVTFEPSKWEKFWGKETQKKEYKKDTEYKYMFGGHVYFDRTGQELGNGNWIGNAIDNFRRSW